MIRIFIILFLSSSGLFAQISTNVFYENVEAIGNDLRELINLDTTAQIYIYYMHADAFVNNREVSGHLLKGFNNDYYIFISPKLNDREFKYIITHEFAHIEQYESGRLRVVSRERNIYVYKGRYFTGSQTFRKQFEIDADRRGKELQKMLNIKI